MSKLRWLFIWPILCSSFVSNPPRANGQDQFEHPVQLMADGKLIDTGRNNGHSGPCYEDFDEDGIRDLIVGDFGGKFQVFRNVGTDSQPTFGPGFNLQAGDKDAEVLVY
jgi:hypothetical protein